MFAVEARSQGPQSHAGLATIVAITMSPAVTHRLGANDATTIVVAKLTGRLTAIGTHIR